MVFDDQGAATPIPVTETFLDDLGHRFGDFSGKLLVSSFRFDRDWDNWEIHPHGDEVVCLLSGGFDLLLAEADGQRTVRLDREGAFVVVPRGTRQRSIIPVQPCFLHRAGGRSPNLSILMDRSPETVRTTDPYPPKMLPGLHPLSSTS